VSEPELKRRLLAEALGTALLLAAIVGSGIMAERLAGGNAALALLANTLATGAMLVVLITMLGPISGAHLNPAMTLVLLLRGNIGRRDAVAYVIVQFVGAVIGVIIAHVMFGEALLQVSVKDRSGPAQSFSEGVATFGLVLAILLTLNAAPRAVATCAGLYITAAYWFTASTSFANPAVTVARSLTNTFAGIEPASMGGFLAAQVAGALAGAAAAAALLPRRPAPLPNSGAL
jgi:glycerol uptake facilitator-like aquaporin